jgi:hypothetical protein
MPWRAAHSKFVDGCHLASFPRESKEASAKCLLYTISPAQLSPPLSQLWPQVASFSSAVAIRSNTRDGFSTPSPRFLSPHSRSPFSSCLLWRRLIALATSQPLMQLRSLFRLRYRYLFLAPFFPTYYIAKKNGFTNDRSPPRGHRPLLYPRPPSLPGERKCDSVQ